MVATNSSTGGYLQPTNPPAPPLEGAALEDFFHDVLVGLTGLDNTLVRPTWQPEPPNIPVKGTVWLGFHFIDDDSDTFPFVGQFNNGGVIAQSELQRHEEFRVHCAIYGTGAGSDARALAKLLRDNIMVPQNQEALIAQGMALIEVLAPHPAPTLTKEIWLYRLDMDIRIRRIIVRDYPVSTIEEADVTIIAQLSDEVKIQTSLIVTNPEE